MYTRKYRYVLRVSTNYKENKERCKQEISKWGEKRGLKTRKKIDSVRKKTDKYENEIYRRKGMLHRQKWREMYQRNKKT